MLRGATTRHESFSSYNRCSWTGGCSPLCPCTVRVCPPIYRGRPHQTWLEFSGRVSVLLLARVKQPTTGRMDPHLGYIHYLFFALLSLDPTGDLAIASCPALQFAWTSRFLTNPTPRLSRYPHGSNSCSYVSWTKHSIVSFSTILHACAHHVILHRSFSLSSYEGKNPSHSSR